MAVVATPPPFEVATPCLKAIMLELFEGRRNLYCFEKVRREFTLDYVTIEPLFLAYNGSSTSFLSDCVICELSLLWPTISLFLPFELF